MDGYALRTADLPATLPVSQRIAAGRVGDPLQPGTAARIFTGAAVPPGADAVVMQESCMEAEGILTINSKVTTGQNIRPQGQDLKAGDVALHAGRRLRPQDLGLLASVGIDASRFTGPCVSPCCRLAMSWWSPARGRCSLGSFITPIVSRLPGWWRRWAWSGSTAALLPTMQRPPPGHCNMRRQTRIVLSPPVVCRSVRRIM